MGIWEAMGSIPIDDSEFLSHNTVTMYIISLLKKSSNILTLFNLIRTVHNKQAD